MIFSLLIPSELQNIFLIVIVIGIVAYLAFKFQIRNIVFIFLIFILMIFLLYFLDLISLEISIFAFLLLPIVILFICKMGEDKNEMD